MANPVYKPLLANQIRLLELYPGHGDEDLEGKLHHAPLGSPESYEALSYVWGSNDKSWSLKLSEGILPITESLHSALKRLRCSKKRLLWADAVCINQDDNIEKSQQVRLMQKIYNTASLVVVDLGEEADNSALALTVFEALACNDQSCVPSVSQAKMQGLEPPDDVDRAWDSFKAVLRRPWFRRIWVVQEFVNARQIRMTCGPWEVDWETMVAALEVCKRQPWLLMAIQEFEHWTEGEETKAAKLGMSSMIDLADARKRRHAGTDWSLLALIEHFQKSTRLATHRRDRLFALLGVAADAEDPRFNPDYEEPIGKVLSRYAATFIEQKKCYEVLSMGGLCGRPLETLGWIPDWTMEHVKGLESREAVKQGTYKATLETEPEAIYDRRADRLAIRGMLVDTISRVTMREFPAHLLADPTFPFYPEYFRKCYQTLDHLYPDRSPNELLEVAWRTLTGNRLDHGIEPPQDLDYHTKTLTGMVLDSEHSNFSTYRVPTETEKNEAAGLLGTFVSMTYVMSFCTMESGTVGLVPIRASPGDRICILRGCPVPFVLCDPGIPETFGLIGECYVQGLMKGELLQTGRYVEEELRLV